MQKNIVFEDKQVIVVYKPAGIATQTARVGQQDMVSELKNYLAGKPEHKGKGEPYLGVVHRLDQPVSGLLVFAKTRRAAAELGRQITNGQIRKVYYAVILGSPEEEQGRLEDYLYKEAKTNQTLVVKEGFPGAKKAVLNYRLIKKLMMLGEDMEGEEVSLLEIELITGRHHQIRAQMAHAGMPILGDSRYGSEKSRDLSRQAGLRSVALSACRLTFLHPETGESLTFERIPGRGPEGTPKGTPDGEIFLPFFTSGI